MLHPRLTPRRLDGSYGTPVWLAEIGEYGAWGDLAYTTRWGSGACGMYEATWTMPLPADFDHPALVRGALVELMDGPWRVGSSLILASPERGGGYDDPWSLTATGVGSEVEGDNSYYALDGTGLTTAVPSVAVDGAIGRGLPWLGRDASVPTVQVGATADTDALNTVGSLLTAAADSASKRWGVGRDNRAYFWSDPTTPTWHVIPGVAALGTTDDDYASTVLVRFLSSDSGILATASATDTPAGARYGHREYPADVTSLGAIPNASAQAFANGILANSKGRLQWTDGLTVSSNELLSSGGVPADLTLVEAGQMIRIHGVFDDLLETSGQTWLDLVIGETKYADGANTIDISPLGLAARDLAAVVESVTGMAAA